MSALNLNTLRRHDPATSEIVESPAHVHLYKHVDEQWTKTGVEGTLLLYRRSRGIAHGFFILNRNGLDNFSDDLADDQDVELSEQFIIFCSSRTQDVFGLWVSDEERRESVGKRMLELARLSKSAAEIGLMPPAAPKPEPNTAPPPTTQLPAPSAAPVRSAPGQPLSIDALFSAAAAGSHAAQPRGPPIAAPPKAVDKPVPATGVSLLDTLFSSAAISAPPGPVPVPAPSGPTPGVLGSTTEKETGV